MRRFGRLRPLRYLPPGVPRKRFGRFTKAGVYRIGDKGES